MATIVAAAADLCAHANARARLWRAPSGSFRSSSPFIAPPDPVLARHRACRAVIAEND
jgi:hypothetical protein